MIIINDRNFDDSLSHVSSGMPGTSVGKSKQELLMEKQESLTQILRSVQWVRLHLSHHVVSRRSLCFVLDTYFEHYKQ